MNKTKRVVMVIAFEGFRDEEYLVPKQIFEQNNVQVITASTKLGNARGKLGQIAFVDKTLEEINHKDYDAIIFVGGPGTPTIRKLQIAEKLALQFYDANKIVAAICWAPTILAQAGLLRGRKATCWVGYDPEFKMSTNLYLESKGATFVDQGVVVDDKIVTANGPQSAHDFGNAILKLLK
ncbi:MAG: DJ-1/PfpI family protein [Candidatus Micrarchaeota archaeon]|nr:DJ-1/PfpI family protein [Candidatus Micrarchaeota archaeon]